jgi:heme-degrading monooxygenase HmoA
LHLPENTVGLEPGRKAARGPETQKASPIFADAEELMVKVLLERTIKGQNVGEIVRLLRQMRIKAMQQPGYISGETLHAADDPNLYLVISTWESQGHWQAWVKSPERRKLQEEVDTYLQSPTTVRIFTY